LGPLGGDVSVDSVCNVLCFSLLHYTAYSPITDHVTLHCLHDTRNTSLRAVLQLLIQHSQSPKVLCRPHTAPVYQSHLIQQNYFLKDRFNRKLPSLTGNQIVLKFCNFFVNTIRVSRCQNCSSWFSHVNIVY
jgi:hypothetical protein